MALLSGSFVVFGAALVPGCGSATIGESRALEACTPDCGGKECGDDGCGGSCGFCSGGDLCDALGTCYDPSDCTPDCADKQCGPDGCGGSCGFCSGGDLCDASGTCGGGTGGTGGSPSLFWASTEQTDSEPWGFSRVECEVPHDNEVTCSDGVGANVTKVSNPIAGGGFAIRHYAELNGPAEGARAQVGIWFNDHDDFHNAMTSGNQVYIAQELYFPSQIVGQGNYPWLSIMDIHTMHISNSNRTHTNPGFIITPNWEGPPGPMYLTVSWGNGQQRDVVANAPMPVGEWFDLEFSYRWTTSNNSTFQVWINGALVITQNNVQTANANQNRAELYMKLYGDDNSGSPGWSPDRTVIYRRNVRGSYSPLTH